MLYEINGTWRISFNDLHWTHRRFLKKKAKKLYTLGGYCELPYFIDGKALIVYNVPCKRDRINKDIELTERW